MATGILERIDLDGITGQAREVRFWRTVATIIAGLLFGLGWVTAKALGVLWLAAAWSAVAVREGWRTGRAVKPARGPGQVR